MSLRHRIAALLPQDKHQKGESYRIRSLYFDDSYSSNMSQNEEGEDRRLKLRARFYENNTDRMMLEVKEKVHGKTVKDSCPLTIAQLKEAMEGIPPRIGPDTPRPLVLLALQMRMRELRPAVIVEYHRSAFTYPDGNVRVTFDQNIAGSLDFENFLKPNIPLVPVLPPNRHIIEIKFDDRMPGEVAQLLETNRLQRIAFSKYTISRLAFEDMGKMPMPLTRCFLQE